MKQLQQLFGQALSEDSGLRLLTGFKPNLSGAMNVHKVFVAASCSCGTSAVLSVEVDKSKTLAEGEDAMPGLTELLRTREKAFRSMTCEVHAQMRSGGITTTTPSIKKG